MTSIGPEEREKAIFWARIAHQAYVDAAHYLRSLPESEWIGPTGCANWSIRRLAGHVAGEAVWFPNVVRGITQREPPLPNDVYEQLMTLPITDLTERIEEAAAQIEQSMTDASLEQLQQPADLGWTTMPLWRSVFISAEEAIFHNWDARVPREKNVTIPTEWALAIAEPWAETCHKTAHKDGIDACPGTYLLRVSDEIGPVTFVSRDDNLTSHRAERDTPDVTLHVTPDQFLRLTAGRLDLNSEEGRAIEMEGDRKKALCLNRIFAGIANG